MTDSEIALMVCPKEMDKESIGAHVKHVAFLLKDTADKITNHINTSTKCNDEAVDLFKTVAACSETLRILSFSGSYNYFLTPEVLEKGGV